MKKIICVLSLIVVAISFQSCTDESEKLEENATFEKQFINPAEDPAIDDDDQQETGG